jgi:hypothetical protein
MRFSPALLAVLLAACGTSDPKPAAEPSSVATAAAAAAPPPASEPTPSAEELKQALAEAELTMPTPSPDEPEYIFGCTTRAHRARVSVKDGVATYEGRKASQAWETEPELTLVGATERTASEDCDARSWTFANEGHTYEVRDGGCDRADSPPPGPWTGKLVIKKGDKVVASDDCGPSGGIARQGWTMRWRPGYMEAQKDGEAPVVIYSDRAERGPGGTVSEEQQTLLSVVGPYISYATQYHATGGAHPSYGVTWTVVDVSMPGRPLDLRELFGAEAVFEQLKRDPAIVAASSRRSTAAAPLRSGPTCCGRSRSTTSRTTTWPWRSA